jgi:hypothetical protein
MANQLNRKRLRQVVLALSLPMGAIAGLACGFQVSGWTWGGAVSWLSIRSDDALGWAAAGAALAGALAHGAFAISWPRLRRGMAGAAPQSGNRTRPPRAESTGSTSSRRKKSRTSGATLQQALQDAGSASLRA